MFALVKFVIAILIMFKLIPKSKLVSHHDTLLLEDEMNALSRINVRQAEDLASIRKDFKDAEKKFQDVFLSEQEAQRNLKNLESRNKKLHQEKQEAEAAEDVATQQYLALQAEVEAATELSNKLKEALTKWMS